MKIYVNDISHHFTHVFSKFQYVTKPSLCNVYFHVFTREFFFTFDITVKPLQLKLCRNIHIHFSHDILSFVITASENLLASNCIDTEHTTNMKMPFEWQNEMYWFYLKKSKFVFKASYFLFLLEFAFCHSSELSPSNCSRKFFFWCVKTYDFSTIEHWLWHSRSEYSHWRFSSRQK